MSEYADVAALNGDRVREICYPASLTLVRLSVSSVDDASGAEVRFRSLRELRRDSLRLSVNSVDQASAALARSASEGWLRVQDSRDWFATREPADRELHCRSSPVTGANRQ